ncbi:hypothetical protein NL317_28175, partial [Klebsiella pneumoniae]|nr:hypothetical protein [Klebsiella pneumoniae]
RVEALTLSDAVLIERLVSLRGVGRWTVEMLLIYSLARADVLPVDDFGCRRGRGQLLDLDKEQFINLLGTAGTQAAGLWEFLREPAREGCAK